MFDLIAEVAGNAGGVFDVILTKVSPGRAGALGVTHGQAVDSSVTARLVCDV